MTLDTIASSPVGTRLLDHLVVDGFATGRPLTDLSEATLYSYVARAAVEASSDKWSASPGRFWPWEQRVSRVEAECLAREVATCSAARWWSDPVSARPQVWIGGVAAAPTAGVPAASCGGKPPTEIWTSSAIAGLPCAWWSVLADGADGPPPEGPQSIWRLTAPAEARVFEVRTTLDWRWLCEAFAGPDVDGIARPDWSEVAEQYDGVHLTVEGLIRAQGVVIETDHGPAMLDNWDSESTAWLRWSVAAASRLGTVTSPESRTLRSRRGGFLGLTRRWE